MKFDDLVTLLNPKRRNDHDYRCKCPAHQGKSDDSLSISPGEDGVALLYCHSGCSYDEIVAALGISRPTPIVTSPVPQNGKLVKRPTNEAKLGEPVAIYDYNDENGRLLFQKLRYEPKTFRVRVPDGKGGWVYKIGDTRRVLYNLQEVIRNEYIFIVEGEKDADRLNSLALTATCNFDGASKGTQKPKWLDEYNKFLTGKTVYILPDNDEPGDAHASYIYKQLKPVAEKVKIVMLPDLPIGGDVSDWLDAGHTVEELIELTMALPKLDTVVGLPKIQRGIDLYNKRFDPLVFLVEGLIAKGQLSMLGGRPKSGKSWLELQMAMAIDLGREFLERKTQAAKILYLALEDGERRVNQRMKILNWQPKQIDFMFEIAPLSKGNDDYPGLEQIETLAPYYDLIIIDTLIATLNGSTNENDNVQMGNVLNGLAGIAHNQDVAISVVHHTGKAKQDDPFNAFRGASAIRGAYDLGMVLDRSTEEREAILHVESRDFEVKDMTIQQSDNGVGWVALGNSLVITEIRAGRRVVEVLLAHGDGVSSADYAKLANVSEVSARKSLQKAEEVGLLTSQYETNKDTGRQVQTFYLASNITS